MKKWLHYLFPLLLIGISVYYNFNQILFFRPQSIHAWRQSDCASLALNYYQNGMNFFSPETHNLTSDGGTSGKCCTSEIPILYYFVAFLYKIFGPHEYIFRIVNTLIFFLGLFYLFKLFIYLLKDGFWAITLPLLIFSSPVLVYYGNNFLSNSSALAVTFIGWYYFIRFIKERKPKWFFISVAVFTIAAAFKITAYFSLFAILGAMILEAMKLTRYEKDRILFQQPVKMGLSILSSLLLTGSWILYARWYNHAHECTYFSTTIFPLWDLSKPEILTVLNHIRTGWMDSYFHPVTFFFLAVCILLILFNIKKSNKLLNYLILLIFAEVILYFLLQFWTFRDHDYYTIDIFILPVVIILTSFEMLKNNYYKIFSSVILKALFIPFLIFNMYHAHQKIEERYSTFNDYHQMADIYSAEPYLRQIGISNSDTIISIPDISHISLYIMNQKGWTEYTDAQFNKGEKIRYNQDSTGISRSIRKGARYMVINGMKELYLKPYLQSFCYNLKGQYNHLLVFDLKSQVRNFNLKQRQIMKKYTCDAEKRNPDRNAFIGNDDTTLFLDGGTQNNEQSHSGKYSSMLSAESPYGMTLKIDKVNVSESFAITAWLKSDENSNSYIVASSASSDFYWNKNKITELGTNGWKKLSMEFFITEKLPDDKLVIYAYNPDGKPVWFDDMEIIRYGSCN